MSYSDFGGAYDRMLARAVDCGDDYETHMDAFIPFRQNGAWYAIEVSDWQYGDDLGGAVMFKLDALSCWTLLDEEGDEAQSVYQQSAVWTAVDKSWDVGGYMTDEQVETANDDFYD